MSDLAALLDAAVRTATAIPQLSSQRSGRPPLTLDEAYAIQAAGVQLRVARGDAVVGAKLGFTSRAKAEQMGVSEVIIGALTASMAVDDGGTLDTADLIHPRVEPEVAFRLTAAGVQVAAALEVIDSRYADFRFDLQDVVADNTSAARYVVGSWQPLADLETLRDLAVTLRIDGEVAVEGSTADILGDPVAALPEVERMAARYGLGLPPDAIVLAGAATAAVPLAAGVVVEAEVAGLGDVRLSTGGSP